MIINKIQPFYTPRYSARYLNFKGKNKETFEDYNDNFFDYDYKKFSKMQKNYYSSNFPLSRHLNIVFPVNGDEDRYLDIARSNIKKLKPQEKIMAFNSPEYTTDEVICSDKGYTDGIFDCITVLLYNKNKAYFYHLCPINYQNKKDIKQMQNVLQNAISDLGQKDCRAFLYGGIRNMSDELYEDISTILDKNEIKRQEVLYSKEGHANHSIYFDIKKGIILSDEIFAYHSKQQLEENFEKVNLQNYFYSEIV